MSPLLTPEDATRGLRRMAGQIVEELRGTDRLLLVGVRRGGEPVAQHLAELLAAETGNRPPVGSVDISLYRDDASTALPNPRIGPTRLPVEIEKYRVLLCDDVLFTGRTIRAAVDALLDYGRPSQVRLAVLLDRDGRELPIQADYRLQKVNVSSDCRVDVVYSEGRFSAYAVPGTSPTYAPPPTAENP